MALEPGYTLTELGLIPNDWKLSQIDDLCECSSGTTPARAFYHRYYKNGSIAWVKTMDLTNGPINTTSECVTDTAMAETSLRLFPTGTVLVAMYGGFQQIGRTGLLEIPAAVNQAITAIEIRSHKLQPQYLLATLNHRVSYWRAVASSSRKDPNITGSNVRCFPIAYPSETEQKKIAAVLSDVDALLKGLERLIVKKRDLKQAAMQQLLTGKTRLPGFSENWTETTLGEIGECMIGLTYKPENVVEHGLLVLRSSNVQNGRLVYDDNVYVNLDLPDDLCTRLGDILVCVRNGSRALIGKCALIDETAVGLTFGAFMSIYRTKYWRFTFHAFQAESIQRQIRDNIGATINQITNKDMRAFRVKLAPDDEQLAISAVLSDMDAEIVSLERRLAKTRDLKQAMMQELLTGRTRLIQSKDLVHA